MLPTRTIKNVYAGFILGGAEFFKDKLNQLQREVAIKDFAHKRAVKNIIDPREVIDIVARYFKLDAQEMCRSNRRPMTAKKAAIYLLQRKTGLTNAQIGEMFGMRYAAVSKAALSFQREMGGDKELNRMVSQLTSKVEV